VLLCCLSSSLFPYSTIRVFLLHVSRHAIQTHIQLTAIRLLPPCSHIFIRLYHQYVAQTISRSTSLLLALPKTSDTSTSPTFWSDRSRCVHVAFLFAFPRLCNWGFLLHFFTAHYPYPYSACSDTTSSRPHVRSYSSEFFSPPRALRALTASLPFPCYYR